MLPQITFQLMPDWWDDAVLWVWIGLAVLVILLPLLLIFMPNS